MEHDIHQRQMVEPSIGQAATLGQRCLAEFIGTAFLVFVGAGTATASGSMLGSKVQAMITITDLLAVALAFGFALTVMFYTIGHISGCHINPAVSIAMAVLKHIDWSEAGAYIVAQLLGALVGAMIIALAFPAAATTLSGYGVTNFVELTTSYLVAVVLEAIGTFFLLMVIMGTAVNRRARPVIAGIAMGLTLAALILALGSVTGGSLNPARTIGPWLVQIMMGGFYPFSHLFAYIIGPIVGGILGAYAYSYLASMAESKGGMRTPAMGEHP